MTLKVGLDQYLDKIKETSLSYLEDQFNEEQLNRFYKEIEYIHKFPDPSIVIKEFSNVYINFIKKEYQKKYKNVDRDLRNFLNNTNSELKLVWGDVYKVFKHRFSQPA